MRDVEAQIETVLVSRKTGLTLSAVQEGERAWGGLRVTTEYVPQDRPHGREAMPVLREDRFSGARGLICRKAEMISRDAIQKDTPEVDRLSRLIWQGRTQTPVLAASLGKSIQPITNRRTPGEAEPLRTETGISKTEG